MSAWLKNAGLHVMWVSWVLLAVSACRSETPRPTVPVPAPVAAPTEIPRDTAIASIAKSLERIAAQLESRAALGATTSAPIYVKLKDVMMATDAELEFVRQHTPSWSTAPTVVETDPVEEAPRPKASRKRKRPS